MRKLAIGLILVVAAAVLPAVAGASTASDEAGFVSRINALRSSQGLAALEVNRTLVDKARGWAQRMASGGSVTHSNLSEGVTVAWAKLGENVGKGGDVDSIHEAFAASPDHRANMVDPGFRDLGVGVAYGRRSLWVSEVFMEPAP
jgi:uncharacterized protein YkwD